MARILKKQRNPGGHGVPEADFLETKAVGYLVN